MGRLTQNGNNNVRLPNLSMAHAYSFLKLRPNDNFNMWETNDFNNLSQQDNPAPALIQRTPPPPTRIPTPTQPTPTLIRPTPTPHPTLPPTHTLTPTRPIPTRMRHTPTPPTAEVVEVCTAVRGEVLWVGAAAGAGDRNPTV